MKDSVPLYQRMKAQLLQGIQQGRWKPGEMLPSEPELAKQFQASRTTVRQALGDLVSSGYVVRQQGKGTFVANRISSKTASKLYGFAEELRQRGLEVRVEIESLVVKPCPTDVAYHLTITPSTPVIYICRTAWVDNQCMFKEESYLMIPAQANVTEGSFTPRMFDVVYSFFERYGIKIALGKQWIRSEPASCEDLEMFNLGDHPAVLTIERVTQDESGSPVEYSKVRYPGHKYEFEVTLLRNVN